MFMKNRAKKLAGISRQRLKAKASKIAGGSRPVGFNNVSTGPREVVFVVLAACGVVRGVVPGVVRESCICEGGMQATVMDVTFAETKNQSRSTHH